jgi:acetylornithine deacetylase/succinyl-diaminopimelate desuccinylase-like protein
MSALQDEAVTLLGQLIRHDTVNPPGNERPAQERLAALLGGAGFEVQLLGRTEERPNLVARLRGAHPGPTLCLLSHVDTVLASPEDWQQDPWSGEVIDGVLWGRGAIDMKSQTAAEVTAAVDLARSGWRPTHVDLLVVVVVDEERGGGEGAIWLCAEHPDAVRCDLLLNEGAGSVIPSGDERLYGVSIAEKGVFRFTLTTDGVAGHASNPRGGDNALLKVAPLLIAMRDGRPGFDVTEGPRALMDGLGVPVGDDPGAALDALRARDPWLATFVEPMLGVTLAPTRAFGSEKINVLPARAVLHVDCRTPPGMEREESLARIQEVLGTDGYRLEFIEEQVGNASPADTPLMAAIARWVADHDPGAKVVPTMIPAFTDSRTFRAAFPECIAYGFFPHRHMTLHETWPLLHAADERIDVRDLGFATDCYRDLIVDLLGEAS